MADASQALVNLAMAHLDDEPFRDALVQLCTVFGSLARSERPSPPGVAAFRKGLGDVLGEDAACVLCDAAKAPAEILARCRRTLQLVEVLRVVRHPRTQAATIA